MMMISLGDELKETLMVDRLVESEVYGATVHENSKSFESPRKRDSESLTQLISLLSRITKFRGSGRLDPSRRSTKVIRN